MKWICRNAAILAALTPHICLGVQSYSVTHQMSPNDYLMGSHGTSADAVFDATTAIELNADLGLTSDCGKINFSSTLKGTLQNVLDEKYFQSLGTSIMGASPMLLACYWSPTWCAILQNSRVSANFLAQMRQNQCGFINKVIDSRAEEYHQERERCVNNWIKSTGGDLESAMEHCQDLSGQGLKNWAGGAANATENRLIESTSQWAKTTSPEAQRTVSLVKSLVGDTVLSNGNISVDYGPSHQQMTPRTYLTKLTIDTQKTLCTDLINKIRAVPDGYSKIDQIVTNNDLKKVSGENDSPLIDRQTLRSLMFMPEPQRSIACRKIADTMSITIFTNDMGKSLDFLSSKVGTNPNLPENRKLEAERKRQTLKDQIDMTMSLYKNRNEPLNQVLSQVNEEGLRYQAEAGTHGIENERATLRSSHTNAQFLDCADGVLCDQ